MSRSLNHGVAEGKAPLHLLFGSMYEALEEISKVKKFSMNKYEEDNWTLDINTEHHDEWYQDNISSMLRHIGDMKTKDKRDMESKLMHSAHLGLRALKAIVYDLKSESVDKLLSHKECNADKE